MPDIVVGSVAPALNGAFFIHSNISGFAPGHGYVIDFWATWCPPCRATLPHLARLQNRYPTLSFAAISIERDPNVVRRYLDSNPNLKNLAIAYDPRGIALRDWMEAAGRNGIPCTFIVNGTGRIAWIGHPQSLETETSNSRIRLGASLKALLGSETNRRGGGAQSIKPRDTPTGAMHFVEVPSRWDFTEGNLVVETSEDPVPRGRSVRTVIKIDGREVIEPSIGSPTLALTRQELSPGRHLFEVVRRDLATGRGFVTDRATVEIIGAASNGEVGPTGSLTASQQNVLRLTNDERAKVGLAALRPNPALMKAAQDYAALMARERHFSHTGPDGSRPRDRAQQAGYPSSFCGENIALGQKSAAEALRSWMSSKGHRENILNREYREIGVGHEGAYWVQLFGCRT